MKAHELRIGNWVITGSIPTIVDGLNKSAYLDPDGDWYYYEAVSPIPLTPEILEKCGFEQSEYLVFKLGYFTLCFYSDGYAYFQGERKVGIGYRNLHQIQNLYFALTGEELQINLNQ